MLGQAYQGHEDAEHDLNAADDVGQEDEGCGEDAGHRDSQVPIELAVNDLK